MLKIKDIKSTKLSNDKTIGELATIMGVDEDTAVSSFAKMVHHKMGIKVTGSHVLNTLWPILTEEKQDGLNDGGIKRVGELKEYLADLLGMVDTNSIDFEEATMNLETLLDYKNDTFVMYDDDGITDLSIEDVESELSL